MLREAEAIAREQGHRSISELPELRGTAEGLLREFFDVASRSDPQWRYAFSSRVPLAIPDYPDIALIFLLRALNAPHEPTDVHVLAADEWQAQLALFVAHGGAQPVFAAGGVRGPARAARSLARRVCAPQRPRSCDVVLFTLGDNVAMGAPDAYFGDLAGAIGRSCSVITVFAASGKRLRFSTLARALPLEAFLHFTDVLRAWTASKPREQQDNDARATPVAALMAYLRAREHVSGEVVMQRVMAEAFERMFARLRPKAVVYPFENRSWEKNLLSAARRHGVARCVGYQHSSLTPRHLAFSAAAGLSGRDDLPDTILTCGEITADRIRKEVPQARTLVTVGAALRARRLPVAPAPKWAVLAPVSSSRAEAWEMLVALQQLAARSDTPIRVRTHPTIPIDDLYEQFRWPAHVQLSRGRSLAEDFEEAALVVYSSSTVALEGMLYGRLPIYLEIGDVPSGNPIDGEHEFAFRAANVEELIELVAQIRGYSQERLEMLRGKARAYAERYLVEPTPANVERMAQLIARC